MARTSKKRQGAKGSAKKRTTAKLPDLSAAKKAQGIKGGALYPHRGGRMADITGGTSNT